MFEYKVRFYNEDSEVSLSHGIIGAKSYSKAAKEIVEYFGKEIITMELSELMHPLVIRKKLTACKNCYFHSKDSSIKPFRLSLKK